MKPREKEALQFRIGLLGILPMVWRRILVPAGYTYPKTGHQDFI
jgi:hypothetical protein